MDINNYLHKFISNYDHFDVEAFIDVEAESYVEAENDEAEDIETISSVMEREKHLVILGNPGTGKSTILVHEALMTAKAYLQGVSDQLPVFVSLKHLMSISDLEEHLQIAKSAYSDGAFLPTEAPTLFLDGLNELNHQIYQQAIEILKQFVTDYPQIRLVITSRKYGYKNQLAIPQYEVQVFDENNIFNYIKKRTGNIQMLIELRKNEMLLSLCSTPLILKMVVDTWLSTGRLPLKLSSLYQEFVENQLNKSLRASKEEKQTLLHVMSILAFELRNTGFISDSIKQVKHIIEYYLEETDIRDCDTNRIWDMLMKSGLVVIYDRGNGFEYVSFLHETFQEYLCSLYLSDYYQEHHIFPIDITKTEWKEATRLALEVIIAGLSNHELTTLLKLMQKSFIEKNTDVIDLHLPRYIELLDSNIEQRPVIFRWLEQYILFNMDNYMALPLSERTTQRFSVITESIFGIRSPRLYQLLFTDLNGWMHEWLYTEKELYEPLSAKTMKNPVDIKARIVQHAASLAKDKALLYQFIKKAEKESCMFIPVVCRLQDLESKLIKSIYSTEAKRIYAQKPSLFFLLLTKDQDMINKEVEEKKYDFCDLPAKDRQTILHKYSESHNINLLSYYYCEIFPKYQDFSLLDKSLLAYNARICPNLTDILLSSPFWKSHFEELAQTLYRLPEEFWSEKYKAALNELLIQKITKHNEQKVIDKNDKPEKELDGGEPEANDKKNVTIHKLRNLGMMGEEYSYEFEESTSRKKLRKWFDGINLSLLRKDFTPVAMLKVELTYYGPEEGVKWLIQPSQEGNWADFLKTHTLVSHESGELETFYFLVNDLSIKENIRIYQLIDGIYYKRKANSYKGYILSKKLVEEIAIPDGLHAPSAKESMSDYSLIASKWSYLIPRSILLPHLDIANMGMTKLVEKGWIGFAPDAIKRKGIKNYKFYLVIRMNGTKGYVIGANSEKQKRLSHCNYDVYEMGDVLLEYQDQFWKMNPSTIAQEYEFYGFKTGVVTNIDNKWAWIREDGFQKQYICQATEGMAIDQSVKFWPTAIPSRIDRNCLEAFTSRHLSNFQ